MRCGCPQCGTYMIQSEGIDFGCVCPECLYRCRACMGTNTVVSRENLRSLAFRRNGERPPEAGGFDGLMGEGTLRAKPQT